MAQRLNERVCVVTGVTGMAEAAAHRFAAEGAAVFVIARRRAACEALVASIVAAGGKAAWALADLRNGEATASAVNDCVAAFGRIDGLFAVAGGSARPQGDGPVDEASLEGFQAALDLNVIPGFLAAREVVRAMLAREPRADGSRGSILLMSSVLATSPAPLFATHGYAAAKGAINALIRAMAARYAAAGIAVNAVAPGLVATPMSERAQNDPESVAYAARKQPLAGGLLPAESAADLATFLLSPEARFITGQVIELDGGWSVTEAPQ